MNLLALKTFSPVACVIIGVLGIYRHPHQAVLVIASVIAAIIYLEYINRDI